MTIKKFKYSLTILNVSVFIGELILIVFTIINWNELSKGEGWGVVAMIGLGVLIISGLIVDFVLQLAFKKRLILNIVCIFFVLIYLYIIFLNAK